MVARNSLLALSASAASSSASVRSRTRCSSRALSFSTSAWLYLRRSVRSFSSRESFTCR